MSEDPATYQIGGDHYRRLTVQPWDAMVAWMSPDEFRGFLRGNAIKYLARAGTKGSPTFGTQGRQRQDYEKARHYLDRLIATYDEEPGT